MTPRDEDEAWREIVDNYGEAPTWEGDAPAEAAEPEPEPERLTPIPRPPDDPDAWHPELEAEVEERFVPPNPPPVPLAEPRRLVAWAGLFLAPMILLVAVVFGQTLPSLVSTGLVCWFIGGFLYLVATMDDGPRDPGDDGARL